MLDYYARCARTNNHTVREAACACVGELAAKVPRDAVAPQAPRMLRLLATCLRDDSWPVRPQALGCGIGSHCRRQRVLRVLATCLRDVSCPVRPGASREVCV